MAQQTPNESSKTRQEQPSTGAQAVMERAEVALRLDRQRLAFEYYESSAKANQEYFSSVLALMNEASQEIATAYEGAGSSPQDSKSTRARVQETLTSMEEQLRREQRNLAEVQHRFALDAADKAHAAWSRYLAALRDAYGRGVGGFAGGIGAIGDEGFGVPWQQVGDPAWYGPAALWAHAWGMQ
jgi:hypothetical protein